MRWRSDIWWQFIAAAFGPFLLLVFCMFYYDDFQSTPTGKVSKAKKGKPVHVCSECQKVYTRAEHLRRHQSSHQEPQFECPVCQRRFHRKDLLERHYKRHEEGIEDPSGSQYME
ncbi:uncharacterized protein FMAN_11740 [Fusarium mangiferae]|uniref:C2H2-type domain-containing protein n=1 Tax=Fusarium mangiferae TaxID=192010 RepID=A0A1L7UMD6_FUSMA|nr:uncharacterized protein FMAN_11740 [Fusarium mangiferae]CVL08947.1 uncharacterized protein FMAN_11740 [Fusarium mangiferae]SCV38971.1 uncharacterized protein FFB14_07058 [Fusarium fujikuroi]